MERAARLIKNNKYSRHIISDDQILRGIWPSAVGAAIARHTYRIKLVRTTLVVEVEDAIWQKQLFGLSRQILSRVQNLLGCPVISDIEFRIAIPRRLPQREETVSATCTLRQPGLFDEADQILDPVLKKVYRLSRKRATA